MDKIKPDGYMEDGTPVYFTIARGSSKDNLQLEMYRSLLGISDEEWKDIIHEVERRSYETLY